MFKRPAFILALLAIGMLTLLGCSSRQESPTAVTPAPDAALESMSSKPQLIEFYADW
jgi:PBP1b-binding outer membrane lipoprotein LpoB